MTIKSIYLLNDATILEFGRYGIFGIYGDFEIKTIRSAVKQANRSLSSRYSGKYSQTYYYHILLLAVYKYNNTQKDIFDDYIKSKQVNLTKLDVL